MSAPDDFAARLRAGAHLDDLTSALDTDQVVTRSRRRRTTGRVATGTVSLALTAGAVLLAPSLLPTRSAPPASTGAPTTSSSQTPSPAATSPGAESPDRTHALPAGFVDGHVPAWLEDSGLACGADAVAPQPAGTVAALRAAGTATSEQTPDGTWLYTFDATLTSAATSTVDLWAPDLAAVAWVQDGRIVGLGPNNAESAAIAALPPDQPRAVHASATRTDYCVPNSDGTYTTDLPAGDYELVLYLRVSPDAYDPATVTWLTSQRLTATLTEDGQLTDVKPEE